MVNKNISSTSRAKPTIQQRTSSSIQNNFTGGLKTEFTGLNFPENACTSVSNCVFTIIGDVLRREGINFEANSILNSINTQGVPVSYFRWLNAGGDGTSQILVLQAGATLYFFLTSASTSASPSSTQLLSSTVNISSFTATGGVFDTNAECTYATGNGYLFIYHKSCDPVYCTYSSGTIVANGITLYQRDFTGIPEGSNQGPNVSNRPAMLTAEHNYNLINQGWVSTPSWTANVSGWSANFYNATGPVTFTVQSGISGTSAGEQVAISYFALMSGRAGTPINLGPFISYGLLTSYSGTSMLINVTTPGGLPGSYWGNLINVNTISITPNNISQINTWFTDIGNYPSNADIWWQYKDSTGTFNPTTTISNVSQASAQAPQGHTIFSIFNQDRSAATGIANLTPVTTTARPSNGCWFQGRVWYTGINASQNVLGDAPFYTWTENIYFSQIITNTTEFGNCFQANDPTNENLFDLLPTDGGVIQIQGSGAIHKLFPIQNGLLVFASNGIWFIRGNSGLGFTANDYSVNKISSVQTISGKSVVDVLGLPMFWNEEGIYAVEPSKEQAPYGYGGLSVNPLTVGTILSFYNDIPLDSKRYARGDYDPLSYTVTWVYRSTEEAGISNRYQFDSALNLNLYNRAFYPYSFANNNACYIKGIVYLNYPSGSLDPQFKYLTSVNTNFTISEENDDVHYVDWFNYDNTGVNYKSNFVTGYQLKGQALVRFQPMFIYLFSRNSTNTAYEINSIWDFATAGDAGKYSTKQVVNNAVTNFGMVYRRHRLRGHGLSLQIQVSSVDGMPFDIMGWTILESISGNV